MITFFTTAKPFRGHDGIIQRNALRSWKLLHPDVEIILFGDDEGAAEICAELGLRHEPKVEAHGSGRYYISAMFAEAQKMARHEYLCYVNCDIIFSQDLLVAFEKARSWQKRFLVVGQRRDVDITEPIDFDLPDWNRKLLQLAAAGGILRDEYWIDYFLFPKGLYADMPALIVGYCYWDNWMIWKTLSEAVPVIDATPSVLAIHQNHGYKAESGRIKGEATDALSLVNLERIGDKRHLKTIAAATNILQPSGIRPNRKRAWRAFKRGTGPIGRFLRYRVWNPVWFFVLALTRPVRHALGLRARGKV